MMCRVGELWARGRAEPAVSALAIASAFLGLVAITAPDLININALLGCTFLFALSLRRLFSLAGSEILGPKITRRRIVVFFLLEFAVLGGAWLLQRRPLPFASGSIVAAVRYAVLLPIIALLPWRDWQKFTSRYRAECWAAAILLLTWFPHRLFIAAWPFYSQALGHAVYYLARPFVSILHYLPAADPTLSGLHLDVTILFGCSGLQAVKLFQIVFAFILIVDWNWLDRRRLPLAYFAGLGMILMANLGRIVLLVVVGNHWSPDTVVRYHVAAGWMYFAAVICILIWMSYDWLRGGAQTAPVNTREKHVPVVAL